MKNKKLLFGMHGLLLLSLVLAVVLPTRASVLAASLSPGHPTFVTNTIEDTFQLLGTTAICGFPVFEHDSGTVITMVTTLPDGSVKSHDIVVKITVTFFSTDPAHTGTATTRPSGPFIEIDHPDGSVTMMGIGQDGHVTIPGQGLVWADIGISKIEIDASGNVTEVQHGIFYPDHSGICPLL
ncbi:MAG TPA: hypothetical protein VK249_06325 [Anaerolineales bacterium]|nr:hypothetical protein [Anaerolineales bacterium]